MKNDARINYTIDEGIQAQRDEFWSWVDFFVVTLSIVFVLIVLRETVFFSCSVVGSSMRPTLYQNDIIVVNRIMPYGRGDVIVFYATGAQKDYIKRVIGLPGDTVKTENGVVMIKYAGTDEYVYLEEDYLSSDVKTFVKQTVLKNGFYQEVSADLEPVLVKDGTVFVLGDNRSVSIDSRSIGLVQMDTIKGVVSQFVIDNKEDLWFLYKIF